jgi:peptidoglycan hydrolase-like protein with peptidoglycan-binding domain
MPLASKALAGDARLEACLVQDSAHLTRGTSGEPVAKVQAALIFLDGSRIDEQELADQAYGPSTAAAVLAYKTRRRIINPSYQQAADDIVGKMTIRSLDEELAAAESRPTPVLPDLICRR